jgi:hypothetical protein
MSADTSFPTACKPLRGIAEPGAPTSAAAKIAVVATRPTLHTFICVRPLIVVAPHHEKIAHPYCRKPEARIYLPFNTQGIHGITGGTVCSFEIPRSGSGAPFAIALFLRRRAAERIRIYTKS